jgi:hypothetical protein
MGIEGTTRLRHQRMIAASCSGPILLEPWEIVRPKWGWSTRDEQNSGPDKKQIRFGLILVFWIS